MLMEILLVIAVVVIGLPYLWRVGVHGGVFAIHKGGPHPFRRHSFRKQQGEQAAVATQSAPPRWTVYTAGSCEQDPGPGGWAYVQVSDGTAGEESGEHPDTTTIRMELTAAIKALEATTPGSTVLVYTGSQFVQQGMTGWVHKWLRNGWRTSNDQPVDNQDLWDRLWQLAEERHVRWEWLDVPIAAATDGEPQQRRVHTLVDAERRRTAGHATTTHAGSHGDETGPWVNMEDTAQQREARTQDMEPALTVRQGAQLSADDRRQALLAECQALERRWLELHEEVVHLNQEWQHVLNMCTSRVEARRNGQSLSWTDGALMFYDLDKHAARTSSLAHEALQTCHHYALALQSVVDTMAEG